MAAPVASAGKAPDLPGQCWQPMLKSVLVPAVGSTVKGCAPILLPGSNVE